MEFSRRKLALALALFARLVTAQIIEPTTAPVSGNTANPTNIVYFAASGSDSNPCTFLLPCQTQSKWEAQAALGNITILMNRGDVFNWAAFGVHNRLTTTASTTPTTNPIAGQNVTLDAYGTGANPIFEGADVLPSTFASLDGTTYYYSYTPGSFYAENIFVDMVGINSAGTGHLLNMPNGPAVTYPAGTQYPGQLVTSGARTYVIGGLGSYSGDPATCKNCARQFAPPQADPTLSGVANVQAYPGSAYNDTQNGRLYVHLLDGSNPNSHVIQASTRQIGMLCEGCNNWLVQNITLEKYELAGGLFTNYSTATATNTYYTNINSQINHINAWDNTSELHYYYLGQNNTAITSGFQFAMLQGGNSTAEPDGVAYGTKIMNSYFGRGGSIPGDEDGGSSWMNVFIQGFNQPEVGNNTIISWMHNGLSDRYNTDPWIHDNNLVGQNRGCAICWANNTGALVERNKVGYGAGDAFQGGGTGASMVASVWDVTGHPELDQPSDHPLIMRNNICTDYGTTGPLYNCWDDNTSAPWYYVLFDGNTCVNSDSACWTFEYTNGAPTGAGALQVTMRNNVGSQHKNYSVYTDRTGVQGMLNNSAMIYFANSAGPGANSGLGNANYFHMYNNVFQMGGATNGFASHSNGSCEAFKQMPYVQDTTTRCVPNTSDPIFTDITNGVYTLKQGSPAVNYPSVGQNSGALGTDYTQIFGARYGGQQLTGGQAIKQ